jgi:hypothetical protein
LFSEVLTWNKCFILCIDGAQAMFATCCGFYARVKEVNWKVKMLYYSNSKVNYRSRSLLTNIM